LEKNHCKLKAIVENPNLITLIQLELVKDTKEDPPLWPFPSPEMDLNLNITDLFPLLLMDPNLNIPDLFPLLLMDPLFLIIVLIRIKIKEEYPLHMMTLNLNPLTLINPNSLKDLIMINTLKNGLMMDL
jgi:hypothetical protein